MILDEEILRLAMESGAEGFGIAPAAYDVRLSKEGFQKWIEKGLCGELEYMKRYENLRWDANALLEGAKSIISLAYPYCHADYEYPVSDYALGLDYHYVLRERTAEICRYLENCGHKWRLCVDSAPISDRAVAAAAGVGFVARNGALTIPGKGQRFFLCEIITDAHLSPTGSNEKSACRDCGLCQKACPVGAITADGIDASRCLSALTMEHKGDYTHTQLTLIERAKQSKRNLKIFGCDICRNVCPLNCVVGSGLPEFAPLETLCSLENVLEGDCSARGFSRLYKGSPLLRAGIKGLRRNLKTFSSNED